MRIRVWVSLRGKEYGVRVRVWVILHGTARAGWRLGYLEHGAAFHLMNEQRSVDVVKLQWDKTRINSRKYSYSQVYLYMYACTYISQLSQAI